MSFRWNEEAEHACCGKLSRRPSDACCNAITTVLLVKLQELRGIYVGDDQLLGTIIALTIDTLSCPPYTIHHGVLRYQDRLCIGPMANLNENC